MHMNSARTGFPVETLRSFAINPFRKYSQPRPDRGHRGSRRTCTIPDLDKWAAVMCLQVYQVALRKLARAAGLPNSLRSEEEVSVLFLQAFGTRLNAIMLVITTA